MGGAVLANRHYAPTERLGEMAPASNRSTQLSNKLHDQGAPERGTTGLSPPSGLPLGTGNRDPTSGGTHGSGNALTGASEGGTQSGSRESTGGPVSPERKSLARRQESGPALSDAQTGPQMSWSIPYHGASFTCRLSTRSPPNLGHS